MIKLKIITYSISLIFLSTLLMPFNVLAQQIGSIVPSTSISSNDLIVTLNPENPRPNESVQITVENYGTDLRKADISWIINGSIVERGTGKTSIRTNAPDVGGLKTITIRITTSGGLNLSKSIELRQGDVALIWEAITTTPPFYKGKALASGQSAVRIVAIPNFGINNPNPESMLYEWERNGESLPAQSGVGKRVLNIRTANVLGSDIIKVKVSNLNNNLTTSANLRIKPVNPEVQIYEEDPLIGVNYKKAIYRSFDLNKNEISIVASPYYFKSEDFILNKLQYNWLVNSKSPGNNELRPDRLILRQEGGSGEAEIKIIINSLTDRLLSASRKIDLSFGN